MCLCACVVCVCACVVCVCVCACSSDPLAGSVSQLIEKATSSEERQFLCRVTDKTALNATLLPIFSVGVQVSVNADL